MRSAGLETLLEMDGWIIAQEKGYWVKIEASQVQSSTHIPQGVSYSLTLHDNHNQRVTGFDNAHAPKGGRRRKFQGQIVKYDHQHKDLTCKGIPYHFDSPEQLIEDFWKAVDKTLRSHGIIE